MKGVKGNEEASIAIYRCAYTVIVRDGHDGTNAHAYADSVAIAKPDSYPVAVAISKPVTEPDT
jgi:hypothetical protein